MNDIQALIDKAREIVPRHTYYQVAKTLGIATQTLSRVRHRGGTLDNEAAIKLADLLGQPRLDVIALMERERAKTPEKRQFWESQLPRLVPVVAILGITIGVTCVGQLDEVVSTKVLTTGDARLQLIHYAQYLYVFTGLLLLRSVRQTASGLVRYAHRIVLQGKISEFEPAALVHAGHVA